MTQRTALRFSSQRGWLSSTQSVSGVVRRMCGGRVRWRALTAPVVSPVRMPTRMGAASMLP